MFWQQGDVLLEKIDAKEIPESAKKYERKNGRFILAEGEVTGHAHAVVDDVEMYEENGTLFIRASKEFTVEHEEHKHITMPPGTYQVQKAVEVDPYEKEIRAVRD